MIEQLEGKKEPIPLTVTGLFDYPRTSNLYEKTVSSVFPSDQPANYIFVPGDILSDYSSWYGPLRLYVYMQDSNQVEKFINDIKIEMGDSTYDPIYWTLLYDYTWDEEWVSTVNKPAKEISNMATATAVGLGIGIFVIILLIYALLLNRKKYELGILLSLGESKPKLVLQTVLEELALVLVALIVAALLAVLAAPVVSSLVMDKPASETNAAIEHQRDEIVRYEEHGDYVVEGDIKSARTTYFYVNNELNVSGSFGVFIAYASIGIVVIIAALAGQVLFFLRRSPARLLLSK
jgi:putative ABC transport system permease protein